MLEEVKKLLALQPQDVVFDGTVGGGGHMHALLSVLGNEGKYIACDADDSALARLRARTDDSRVVYCNGNFRSMDVLLQSVGVQKVDAVLLDLGISSDQLTGKDGAGSGRGFSFLYDEPLTMTLASEQSEETLTAGVAVNTWSEESLADVIYGFGEERHSRAIARAIVAARESAPIRTTGELSDIVARVVRKKGKTHPATKTFQALRIAVNDELGALTDGLSAARRILAPQGRIAVITFHSLEDRIVKRTFKEWEQAGYGTVLTKKPLVPERHEVTANPRARSAKLRGFRVT